MLFPAAPTLEEEHAESYVSLPVSMFGNGTFEKDLNTLAVENNIQPNLLRNWKKEFLDNAFAVFDDKREDNLKEKLAEERKEKAEYAKKVGQLTMQVDWLKKI
mgnify:CR=1 FL=1